MNVALGTERYARRQFRQLREAMKNAGGGGVSYFSVTKLKAETNKNNDGAKADYSLAIGVAETEIGKVRTVSLSARQTRYGYRKFECNPQEVTKAPKSRGGHR